MPSHREGPLAIAGLLCFALPRDSAHSACLLLNLLSFLCVASPLAKIHAHRQMALTSESMVDIFMQNHENKIMLIGNSSGKYRTKLHRHSFFCIKRWSPSSISLAVCGSSSGLAAFCRDHSARLSHGPAPPGGSSDDRAGLHPPPGLWRGDPAGGRGRHTAW